MNQDLNRMFEIRYTKTNFIIQFMEDTIMPEQKASALRGGIGEMLLRANCIRDRNCKECDFETECIVQRTMYSKFEKKPEYITSGDSIGYVMECEDYRTVFHEGDSMRFSLILFGKTIVYFNQYLQATFALGQYGVGKNHSRFDIVRITNHKNQELLSGNDIYMERYEVKTVGDYVRYRMKRLEEVGFSGKIEFRTPLTLKHQGEFIRMFDMEAVMRGIARRIFMLDCFEGIETEQLWLEDEDVPEIIDQRVERAEVRRYSNRQKMSMDLHGIKGECLLEEVNENALELLLAGELIHIGKNTSFGFGKLRLV